MKRLLIVVLLSMLTAPSSFSQNLSGVDSVLLSNLEDNDVVLIQNLCDERFEYRMDTLSNTFLCIHTFAEDCNIISDIQLEGEPDPNREACIYTDTIFYNLDSSFYETHAKYEIDNKTYIVRSTWETVLLDYKNGEIVSMTHVFVPSKYRTKNQIQDYLSTLSIDQSSRSFYKVSYYDSITTTPKVKTAKMIKCYKKSR